MSTDEGSNSSSISSNVEPHERFNEFLEEQAAKGISQQEVARRLAVSSQFVSDVKTGRRKLSDLFARRLEDEFGRPRAWFRGIEAEADEILAPKRSMPRTHLPVFPEPIRGDPYGHPTWNGTEIEVCGVAALRAVAGRWSYLLQFGIDDRRHRLRRNDLILISQEVNPEATIQVLESLNKGFLARRKQPDGWEALSLQRQSVGDATIIGHCLGIVWAAL